MSEPCPRRPESSAPALDGALAAELAPALAAALSALYPLRLATLYLASRPGPVDAERALLRLALRTGHRGPLPLTGGRALVWRAWSALDGDGSPRERWRALRGSLDELRRYGCDAAREAYAEAERAECDVTP